MNDTASYPSFSYDTFVDNIRVVKLDPVQKYMSNRLDTDLSFECPNTSPMDYADGETIQCINQNSGFYRFNKTVYSLWEANPTTRASNPFLRSYGKDAKGFNPTNLNYYKIFDCSVKWGATAFGSPLIFKYPLSCDVYSPPNLVVNGGFESNCKNTNPAFSGSYSIYGHCDPNTLSNVTNQLTGWSTGYQDVIHNPGLEPLVTLANGFLLNSSVKPSTVASFAGSFSVALFTFKSSSSAVPVRIHQVINFTRGTYRLSFRVRPTPGVAWTSGTTAAAATVAIRSQNVVAGYCPGNYPGNCPTWGPYFMSPTNISYYSNNWTLINLEFSIHDGIIV